MAKETTPAMEQFLRFKSEYPDAILLFRMGDFYETFFEDAKEVSRLLGLTLTSRNNGRSASEGTPMAGVPYHALDTYLARLIRFGKRVAICEQMEAPQKGKAVVRREVVQVVTPGTALSENLLDQKRNNYLASICVEGDRAGVAVTDLSTGLFQLSEGGPDAMWDLLKRLGPSELLAPDTWAQSNEIEVDRALPGVLLTRFEDWYFGQAYAYDALLEHFRVASLKGFGCDDLGIGICAAGGLLCYLQRNQKGALSHIVRMSRQRSDAFMALDMVTQRNLELVASLQDGRKEGTLVEALDKTRSAPGARMLRSWLARPLLDIEGIRARQDAVAELVSRAELRGDLRTILGGVGDIERLMSRICCGRANPRDFVGLKHSLSTLPDLRTALERAESGLLGRARDEGLPNLGDLVDLIGRSLEDDPPMVLTDGGVIRTGFNPELDELREVASGGRNWVARLQTSERERTGIDSLKVGYNRAFGYYIEVSRAKLESVPEDFIRKQTLVNAERFITPDLKEWEAKILGADERAKELEKRLFQELRDEVAVWVAQVQTAAETVATLDVLACLAETAEANDYVRPSVDEGTVVDVKGGRHPVVEKILPAGKFVPNDHFLDGDREQILIVTGPNMAGKSTILRQVGLIVLLAQVGSYVPARSARIGMVDRIFTRVGASDNLARGESTFLVEMNEAANILNNATPKSLVLLDEIGRGTSTFDGLSIAWAMTEYLHNSAGIRPRTLFATHYHELTDLERLLPRVVNYSVAVRKSGDDIAFLHRLVRGGCDHSYGIEVARMAGMPPELVARAKEVLSLLEQNELALTRWAVNQGGEASPVRDQMSLFEHIPAPAPHPILDELRALEVGNTTPLEALEKLDEWRRRMQAEDGAET